MTAVQFAIDIVMDRWDELDAREFASLTAELFYEMACNAHMIHSGLSSAQVKQKSKFPLHAAVSHGREDVVFLYLIEFDAQLKTKVNEVRSHVCLL